MRDLTRPCQDGYDKPLDRCPSDSDSRAAFTIGRRCMLLLLPRPTGLTAGTDPQLGDLFLATWLATAPRLWQAWPHPQNPAQLLVVEAPLALWDVVRG